MSTRPAMPEYVVWGAKSEGNSCMLEPPENIDREWELYRGIPRAVDFSSDALFRMSSMHPRDVGMPDNLMNLARLVVVHARIQAFLSAKSLVNVEYLPVSIVNHKKRVASEDYFIVHPIHPQDCLDIAASEVTWNAIIPTDISSVKRLVLDIARIDPAVRMFRVTKLGAPVLVERSLAQEILDAGFTGVSFIELDEFHK